MPDVNFGAANYNSWFDYSNQLLYTNISVPARRVAANGQGPQLITHVSAYIAGYTTTVTLKLYAGGKKTGTITRSADSTPGSTGLTGLTSNLYIANGTTVSFGASDNNDGLYFYRSSSGGSTTISPNGYSWSGTLAGGYRYLESPTAPRTLTATPSGTITGQVNLSWLSPSDDGGSSVTNYNVYRLSGGTYTLLGSTTGTTYSATGLTAGTSYTFVVRARNAVTDTAGTQSVDSNTATATAPYIPPPTTVPSAPQSLTATTSTAVLGAVNLSWSAPSSDGGLTITNYYIYVNGVYQGALGGASLASTPDYVVTGLTQLTTYSFTVAAVNADGTGPQSTGASGKASGVPTAPTGLTATPDTLISEKINLSWTAPADSGGGISGYQIYNATTNGLIADQAGTGTTYSNTGLTAGTEYFYYVRAYNAFGVSPATNYGAQSDVDSAVAEDVSGAPSVVASTVVAGRVTITWVENIGATSYTIRNKNTGASVVVSSNILSYVWDGLTADTRYGFTKQPNGGDESEIGYGTPLGTSIQPLTTSKTVTNNTNTELSVASAKITGTTSNTFTYSKDVLDLPETQVSSSSAVVTNKTNQDLTDSDGIVVDTISATPTAQTFSYLRSGVALTETNVTGGTTLLNTTNAELSEAGVSVVVPAGPTPDTFTYTTTRYTGGPIEIASGGTATNLSQTDFNITRQPVTAVTEYTLSYDKTTADQDASAATGTVVNETNKEVFNKTVGVDKVLSVPDYKTVQYAVVGGLHADIGTTSQSGTTVTVTTVSNPYFRVNDIITIQGSTNGSKVFNGQWTVASVSTPATVAISTTARSAYTVTVATGSSHGLSVGEYVVIAGSANGGGVLNGKWVVASTPSTTEFTFTHTATGTIGSASDSLATVAPPSRFTFTRGTSATIASAPDATAKADADIPVTTVANPLDSATRTSSSPEAKLEVIYRSGWIG